MTYFRIRPFRQKISGSHTLTQSCGSEFIKHFKWIRIQSGSRVLMTKNWKRKYSWFFLNIFLIKNCNLLMSKLQEKPSALKREHRAHQEWNLLTFSTFVGHFCPPGSQQGSRDPIESRSSPVTDPDPDPQHCLNFSPMHPSSNTVPVPLFMRRGSSH
jgi:hypothetical protein